MSHASLNFHNVASIKVEPAVSLRDSYGGLVPTRTIVITDEAGQTLHISLFASDEQKLFMLGDPAPALGPAKIEEAA